MASNLRRFATTVGKIMTQATDGLEITLDLQVPQQTKSGTLGNSSLIFGN